MTTPPFLLHFVVALHCEAKPLIEHFQLKKVTNRELPFSIFTQGSIYLIISGVGKVKMAAATTFLHLFTGARKYGCFLNIGIAGANAFSLGDAILAHQIMDAGTQRYVYPFISPLKKFRQGCLISHDIPQQRYPENSMVDMEGSAFFQTAALYVSQEQIHVLKIISDVDENSFQQIDEARVTMLIKNQMTKIVDLTEYLKNLSMQEYELEKEPESFKKCLEMWHFTHSQAQQLKEHLRRWQNQMPSEDVFLFCQSEKSAKHVIAKIMGKLDNHANCLY